MLFCWELSWFQHWNQMPCPGHLISPRRTGTVGHPIRHPLPGCSVLLHLLKPEGHKVLGDSPGQWARTEAPFCGRSDLDEEVSQAKSHWARNVVDSGPLAGSDASPHGVPTMLSHSGWCCNSLFFSVPTATRVLWGHCVIFLSLSFKSGIQVQGSSRECPEPWLHIWITWEIQTSS